MTLWISTLQLPAQNSILSDSSHSDGSYLILNRWTKDKIYSNYNYPYVSADKNESWYVEQADQAKGYVRFKHQLSGYYMMSILDSTYLAPLGNHPEAANWKLEQTGTYVRIRHVISGLYLNTETGRLKLSKSLPGWLSSHWKLESRSFQWGDENQYALDNRWTREHLSIYGYLYLSKDSVDRWNIINVYDGKGTVKLRHSTGQYLSSARDSMYLSKTDTGSDTQWRMERYGDYFRIANPNTGNYLNNERKGLWSSATVPTWFSNQWSVVRVKK